MKKILAGTVLAAAALTPAFAAAPAHAAGPWQTTTVVSTQEGCGPDGLTMDVEWRKNGRGKIDIDNVRVDNSDLGNFTPRLYVEVGGQVVYAGPNSHGKVGDGKDYGFYPGTFELNDAGQVVPVGASSLNPDGWQLIKKASGPVKLTAVWTEARYCYTTLTLNA